MKKVEDEFEWMELSERTILLAILCAYGGPYMEIPSRSGSLQEFPVEHDI